MTKEIDFLIIANLLAGSGSAKEKLVSLQVFLDLHKQTYKIMALEKESWISQLPFDPEMKIKRAVICLGGDGTVSETLGYVIGNKITAPVALLPTGTANIIAGSLAIKPNPDLTFLLKEKIKEIDVGTADYGKEKNYFLLGIGLGFEENFLKITRSRLKHKIGIFSYFFSALGQLFSLPKIKVSLINQGKTRELNICLLTILNLKPKIFKFFPIASSKAIQPNDRLFNIYYVEFNSYPQALFGTLAFHLIGRPSFGLVKSLVVSEASLQSPGVCGTQVDGEIRACLPVKIYFHSSPAKFLIP